MKRSTALATLGAAGAAAVTAAAAAPPAASASTIRSPYLTSAGDARLMPFAEAIAAEARRRGIVAQIQICPDCCKCFSTRTVGFIVTTLIEPHTGYPTWLRRAHAAKYANGETVYDRYPLGFSRPQEYAAAFRASKRVILTLEPQLIATAMLDGLVPVAETEPPPEVRYPGEIVKRTADLRRRVANGEYHFDTVREYPAINVGART